MGSAQCLIFPSGYSSAPGIPQPRCCSPFSSSLLSRLAETPEAEGENSAWQHPCGMWVSEDKWMRRGWRALGGLTARELGVFIKIKKAGNYLGPHQVVKLCTEGRPGSRIKTLAE